ncbi:MAG: hypothetical protein ABIQ24_11485 [Nitrospiraceae bacterium]
MVMVQALLFILVILPMLFSILPAMGLLPARFTGRMPDSTCDTKVRRG